ncbi:MAG: hypothetical protein QNJ45_21400 [Ardenticatenaceae bacterium]|nr:hypothetical protein [Ardenticatenaceae bacterium]
MTQILVVCTANICRSPVAEALLQDRLTQQGRGDWRVVSAGTWAVEPREASRFSREVLLEREKIDISNHRAQMVNEELINQSDLIVCMEKGHVEALRVEFPAAADKIYLLSQMVENRKYNISDPYGSAKLNYEKMVREVQQLVDKGLPQIIELAGRPPNPER